MKKRLDKYKAQRLVKKDWACWENNMASSK